MIKAERKQILKALIYYKCVFYELRRVFILRRHLPNHSSQQWKRYRNRPPPCYQASLQDGQGLFGAKGIAVHVIEGENTVSTKDSTHQGTDGLDSDNDWVTVLNFNLQANRHLGVSRDESICHARQMEIWTTFDQRQNVGIMSSSNCAGPTRSSESTEPSLLGASRASIFCRKSAVLLSGECSKEGRGESMGSQPCSSRHNLSSKRVSLSSMDSKESSSLRLFITR